jgi:predicted Zn-dependent protease
MFVELGLYFGEIRRFTAKYGRNHMNSTQSEFYRKLCSLQELRNSPGYREALSKIDTAGLKRYRNMIRDLFSLLNGNVIFNVCSADVTMQENDTQENSEERGNFYEEYTQRQIELQAGRRNYV